MTMKKRVIITALTLLISLSVWGQDTLRLTLADAIRIGQTESVQALVARNEFISAYWEYRTYKTELLPEVILNGTVPYYSKSFNSRQNEDGSYSYVENNYTRIDGGLSITQNIPWTGGRLTLESSVERLRQNGKGSSTSYKSIPGAVTLEQPILGFNRVRWLQKIEPVKYREARQKLASSLEDVSLTVIQYYFELLIGQISLDISVQNRNNADRLYKIAEARHQRGQLSEVELMQMKNTLLKAEAALTDALTSLDARMFQLRSFLAIGQGIVLEPVIPEWEMEVPSLGYAEVLELALDNNSFTQNIQRRMLEASRNVSQAKADRLDVRLFASFGMSGRQDTFQKVFSSHHWREDQQVNIGLRVPILDWGKGKGKVRVAEANRELEESRIEKEKMDFNQDIYLRVKYFNNQPSQLKLAREMDRIAGQRYEKTVEAFVQGQMEILNLNDAQTSKDEARRNYIQQLHLLWSYYYEIRGLTLYDFVRNKPLETDYRM